MVKKYWILVYKFLRYGIAKENIFFSIVLYETKQPFGKAVIIFLKLEEMI